MADVALDISVLKSASSDIRMVARSVAETVESSHANEFAFGSAAVAGVLNQVNSENLARAEIAGESLGSAGRIPETAATRFAALDRRMVSVQ